MKRRFTILTAAFALLVSLAFPLGMWGQTTATYSLTPDQASTGSTETSYITTLTEFTYNGISWKMNQWNPSTLQIKTNQSSAASEFRYYNTSAIPGRITQVVMSFSALTVSDASKLMFLGGTSEVSATTGGTAGTWDSNAKTLTWTPGVSDSFTFFAFYQDGKAASGSNFLAQTDAIVVTYESNGQQPTTYNVNLTQTTGGTISANPTTAAEGETVTLTATPDNGYSFDSWSIEPSTVTITDNQFTMPASNVTVSAEWTENTTPTPSSSSATLTQSNLELTGSYTTNTEKTIDGITYVYTDLMKNNDNIQAKASTGTIKNSTAYPGDITEVKITHSGTARATTINGSADGTNWTQVATGSGSITADFSGKGYKYFQITRGSNAAYWTKIEIAWADGNTPTISASNVEITYDATSGNIAYTINNEPEPVGTMTADINGTPTIADFALGTVANNAVPFTCAANTEGIARTATVTLTYTYGDNETVIKDVTVTQAAAPVTYTTIPALFAAATSTETPVYVTFNNWVVSGVSTNGKNVFVTDNNGHGFVIFDNDGGLDQTYSSGNILSGTAVSCNLVLYNGFAELKNVTASDLTITTGGTVAVAEISMANLNGVNTGALLHYENLTCSVNNNRYYLSDGTTTLQVFNALYAFDALEDGMTYNITGVYQQYNSTKEIMPRSAADIEEVVITTPSITVDPATVSIPVEGAEGTLTVTYENITEIIAEVYFCDAEGAEATYDWITAEINDDNNIEYLVEENDGEARTAYLKVYALDDNTEDVYSNLITVSQAAYVAPAEPGTWILTDLADLTADDIFVIVGTDADNDTFALPNNGGTTTAPSATAITIVDGTISGEPAKILQWNLSGNATDGYTFYPNGNTASWLYCTNTNNGVRVGTNDNKTFKMDEDGYMVNDATSRVLSIFVNNGIPQDWRCYANYNNNPVVISFYKKVEPVEPETYTLDIAGYGNSAGGYYLIASPVASVTPSTENGFLTEAYDLYEFDQSADNEWVNYEQHGFDIVSGKGYLYASQANTTLTFEGQPYNGNGKIDLVYDENANLKGWNLIGNPFGVTATVDHDYYIMNENGDNFMLTSKETPIDAMQGIFIVTESADDNKAVFTTEEPAAPGEKLVLNVTHNRGVVDRAMIRFGEGQQMPKAMMSPNNTKIYIEQANNDYAVVRSDNESEMPISFKAADNGTYTLSIDADNVEMDYLHLVDNMTGMDVDLLANPGYTFEANTTDYACRFKLVYKNTTGIEESSEHFAYFNGNEWVVSNEGDAQLHVIDMTGRIVSNETLNGNATVKVTVAPGVYMLRLVNGNDIKTQKVIIK
ncbi:MAG: T9SS type A sorting domain-containing protein [Bacteroidales bacterium]|nr:T9SS type A sorting domain-containing protein [Bacteroidales bacterium]